MDISLDLAGRRVLVFGGALAARRVLARFLAAEAIVYLASVTVDGHPPERPHPQVRPVEYPHFPHGWRDLVSAVDLVVLVEVSESTERIIVDACAAQRVWLSREPAASVAPLGRVTRTPAMPPLRETMTFMPAMLLRRV
ncbi:NAD(P)-dependent oxidoreductase, partial [Cryobacterium sp. RTC2.1]|uniref:NAD(P)-dependent oxidoreductase n=1 Tax=Cryobacterium sp. RTC2.1 TaxID=3048634 RepID=UPI002B23E191